MDFSPFRFGAEEAAALLHRLAWGPSTAEVARLQEIGLTAFVDEQLAPWVIDDEACEKEIAAGRFASLSLSPANLWRTYYGPDKDFYKPFREVALSGILRCIMSRRQLLELMVHFWHDHFHVTGSNTFVSATLPHLNQLVRRHSLGNFHQLLVAVAETPSMLLYLDNAYSKAEDPNENYARELLELHTLGVDGGYDDDDVWDAARILTGWTIDDELTGFPGDGTFAIHDEIHDFGAKTVLGRSFPAGRGAEVEGRELLDLLAFHPSTARHVAWKLCRRLVSDTPPEDLVERAAAVFRAKARDSDQIAATLRVILLDSAFRDTWGEKIKRPLEIAVALWRGCGFRPPLYDDGDGAQLLRHLQAAGHHPMDWGPPNGFPDFKEAWNGAGTRMMSWRLVNFLVFARAGERPIFDPLAAMPAEIRRPGQIVDFWSRMMLGRLLPDGERAPLVGHLRAGDGEPAERLRSAVALLAMTPSFLER
jgi:hypothetical protein